MFTHAIVRKPGESLVKGLTSANMGIPDYAKALEQHANYVSALEQCGLSVQVLEADEQHPDSCFVEDVALLTPKVAIITRPGASSRRHEVLGIEASIHWHYDRVEHIVAPGTVEAGDIMMVGDHYYIGLSKRTNMAGAVQMISILQQYGLTGSTVRLDRMLHLKTGLAYLEHNFLLVAGEFIGHPDFKAFKQISVPDSEAYAANCIWVNDRVLVPAGYPITTHAIIQAGYEVKEVEVSEFQKLDGGLSCLSLRF